MNFVKVSDRSRILITRLSHIGDCILTLPLAQAIRQAYPKAWIAWAIESPGDRLIQECSAVDEVIRIPKGWLKKPRQAWALRKHLRELHFDLVVDPQSLTKSAAIGWLAGVKSRIGLQKPLGRELAPVLNNNLAKVSMPHVVDRSLEMLKTIGIHQPTVNFGISVPEEPARRAAEIISKLDQRFSPIIVNPGAGWSSRQWSNFRFGKVAAYLRETFGLLPLVTWFGDQEETMADEIVRHSDGLAVKAPATGLWELGGLIARSRFYIGCDTGPTHLAAALGCPCIALFGTTEPQVSGPYDLDPDRPIHLNLQRYYQAGTSRKRRKAENAAMMQIDVKEVCSAVDQMVSQTDQRLAV